MSTTLTTTLRSLRSLFLEAVQSDFRSVDVLHLNLAAHARTKWGNQYSWQVLLARIADMKGDTVGAAELWDLQMITNAGQIVEFSPWGCHVVSGAHQALRPDAHIARLNAVFAGNCRKLWQNRESRTARQYCLARLKRWLVRIERECQRLLPSDV